MASKLEFAVVSTAQYEDDGDLANHLDGYGKDGWEFLTVVGGTRMVFSRRLSGGSASF